MRTPPTSKQLLFHTRHQLAAKTLIPAQKLIIRGCSGVAGAGVSFRMREGQNCKSHFGSFTAWGYYSVSLSLSLPSGLHLGSHFWGSPPSLLQPPVFIPTQCVNGGREPLARQPQSLRPSKDSPSGPCPAGFLFNWPTLWGAIEIKWPLAGWLCNGRHSWPYQEHLLY